MKKVTKFVGLVALAICFPVMLNFFLFREKFTYAYGNSDTWLSFWGNYSGGIVSGIVAYIVARTQIKEQYEKQLEADKNKRIVDQLPALVRIKRELETFIKEFERVQTQREQYIAKNGGIREPLKSIEDERKGIPEYEIVEKHYILEAANKENWSYLERIQDINLHVELLVILNNYEEFHDALTYDMEYADAQRQQLKEKEKQLVADGQYSSLQTLMYQVGMMYSETDRYYSKKKEAWTKYYEKNYLDRTRNLLMKIEDEIQFVRRLQ